LKIEKAFFEAAAGTSAQLLPPDLPEIVFSGKSNVGKSSLINKLLNRKGLARTSATPGKTITINFFRVDDVRFVDLPGYGYAKVSQSERVRWSELVEGYFSAPRDRRLVLQLVDMRHEPSQEDVDMINYLQTLEIPYIIVLTKSDKLNQTERKISLERMHDWMTDTDCKAIIPFSALKGEGAGEILSVIRENV